MTGREQLLNFKKRLLNVALSIDEIIEIEGNGAECNPRADEAIEKFELRVIKLMKALRELD